MPRILVVESNPKAESDHLAELSGSALGLLYAAVLEELRHDVETVVISPYDGDNTPDLAGFDGIVFTGSSVEWNTDDDRAAPLAEVMRDGFAAGLPTIGSCNGMQLAASVLGGSAAASPNGREDGMAMEIRLTEAGQNHPMMAGRSDGYAVPCTHRDEVVRLPEGAVLLAGNDHSPVQAFAIDRDGVDFWGMQYHPEFSPAYVGRYLRGNGRISPATADDLEAAQEDPSAAARLSTTPQGQSIPVRTTELVNWLVRF